MKDGVEGGIRTIMIAAGIVITLIVITIAFFILNQGQNTTKNAIAKIDKINNQMSEADITMYDGLEVSGTDVINAVNKFKSDKTRLAIKVATNRNTTGAWFLFNGTTKDNLTVAPATSMTDATDPANAAYITPNGRFTGVVDRDTNGTIATLTFTQK